MVAESETFYLHGQDLKKLRAAEVMALAHENGYNWLLPLIVEKEAQEGETPAIIEAKRILAATNN